MLSPPGGGDSHMEWTGILVVSLRGVNFGFWSHLGCSGQNVIIFSRQGLVKGCTEEITKRKNFDSLYLLNSYKQSFPYQPSLKVTVLFICQFYKLVSFRGLHKLWPRPDWSLLGVKFKISDEHPRPLHMGVPPPPRGV